jgi:2-polyprenyl-6-methoxyphenol hydroxylase-like FAD-dependent oxidoreductase
MGGGVKSDGYSCLEAVDDDAAVQGWRAKSLVIIVTWSFTPADHLSLPVLLNFTMTTKPISIIGAGLGGLTLGRALLKHGIPAVLYEQKPLSKDGYGITLHPSSYRPLLDLLDMDESKFRRTVAVDSAVGGTGALNLPSMLDPSSIAPSSFRAHRKYLERLLREGLDIRWKHKIDGVETSATGAVLRPNRRTDVASDCIIGVDGVHSSVRKSMLPHTSSKTLPFVVYYRRRKIPRAIWDIDYAPYMHSSTVLQTRHGNTVLQLQVNHQNADATKIGWIYSRPARGPTDALYRPDRPLADATTIPEEFFNEVAALQNQNLPQPFHTLLSTSEEHQDGTLHWLMRTTSVSKPDLVQCTSKRVVLIGDAVHAEPIVGGCGANAAIEDGVELANHIARHGTGTNSLSAFYEERYPVWRRGVEKAERTIAELHA